MRRFTVGVLVSVTVLTLAACGGSKSSKPAGESERKQSNVEKLSSQVDPDGYMERDAALQLFALQYGPLPGVQTPSGGTGIEADGNLAISGVFRHWATLTEEQRTAIRKALELPAAFVPKAGPGKSRPVDTPSTFPPKAAIDAEVGKVQALLAAHVGPLSVPVVVETSTTPPKKGALADALIYDGDKGKACYIRLFPDTFALVQNVSTFAHELFHCYQQDWYGRPPGWLEEGTAEWVGAVIAGEAGVPFDAVDQKWITTYADTANKPLFTRAYDAVGWFAYLNQSGVDVWSRLKAIISNPGAAYATATAGTGVSFIEGWGPAQIDNPSLGPPWVITGTGIPPASSVPSVGGASVKNGATFTLTAPAYAAARKQLSIEADVVTFLPDAAAQGMLRVGSANKRLPELTGFLCSTSAKTCECPPGTVQEGTEFPRIEAGPNLLAISGGSSAATLSVIGQKLEDACNAKNCIIGTWTMKQPPAIKNLEVKSGGTGAAMTITPNGKVTLDWNPAAPYKGNVQGGTFELSVRGIITADVAIPTGSGVTQPIPFTNAQLTGATGSGNVNIGGYTVPIPEETIASLLALGNGGSGTNLSSCSGDTLSISSGSGTWTFSRTT